MEYRIEMAQGAVKRKMWADADRWLSDARSAISDLLKYEFSLREKKALK